LGKYSIELPINKLTRVLFCDFITSVSTACMPEEMECSLELTNLFMKKGAVGKLIFI